MTISERPLDPFEANESLYLNPTKLANYVIHGITQLAATPADQTQVYMPDEVFAGTGKPLGFHLVVTQVEGRAIYLACSLSLGSLVESDPTVVIVGVDPAAPVYQTERYRLDGSTFRFGRPLISHPFGTQEKKSRSITSSALPIINGQIMRMAEAVGSR